jgi:ribosome maturation factor RimP
LAVIDTFYIFAPGKRKEKEGNRVFPSSINSIMMMDQLETVQRLLQPLLTDDIFLVDVKIRPINNIKIYLDADNGLGIERCIKINRALYKVMEEMAIYPDGDFSLEVSSPGIDEPLKMHRQYLKNIGREIEIKMLDDTLKLGKLIEASEEHITIEYTEGKNKKAVTHKVTIPFAEIKHTKVQVKF